MNKPAELKPCPVCGKPMERVATGVEWYTIPKQIEMEWRCPCGHKEEAGVDMLELPEKFKMVFLMHEKPEKQKEIVELKPCPSCEGTHIFIANQFQPDTDEMNQTMYYRISCSDCGMNTNWHASQEQAKEVWDRCPRNNEKKKILVGNQTSVKELMKILKSHSEDLVVMISGADMGYHSNFLVRESNIVLDINKDICGFGPHDEWNPSNTKSWDCRALLIEKTIT